GVLRRRGSPLQFVERLRVVLRRARKERSGEDLSEGGVPPAPPLPHQLDQRLELLRDAVAANGWPAAGAAADQDARRDALRVTGGIGRRHRGALRDAENGRPRDSRRVDNGREVRDEILEGDRRR